MTEEKILSGYYLDPLLVVGLEGFWGCCYYAILLPIFQHVKCTNALCHDGQLENTTKAFQQFGENPVLIFQSIGIIISIACFNATGVAITKYASAAQRSTVDTCRTFLIWLISMIIGWEIFHALELVGFFMLVFGTIIYNEIYVLPVPLFAKNTKRAIAEREGRLDNFDKGNESNYMNSSPKAYDYNRNVRNIEEGMQKRHNLLNQHDKENTGDLYINDVSDKSSGKK